MTNLLSRRFLDVEIIATECSRMEMDEKMGEGVLGWNSIPNETLAT